MVRQVVDYTRDKAWNGIEWSEERSRSKVTQRSLAAEYAYVVHCSGFNAGVVSKLWGAQTTVWDWWIPSILAELEDAEFELKLSRSPLANRMKLKGIVNGMKIIDDQGVEPFLLDIEHLKVLPYIGDVTKFHLGKNLGYDVVKPDLHLVRIQRHYGWKTVESMCQTVRKKLKVKRLASADWALWVYAAAHSTATLEPKE
jgi:hypothetical protein